MPHTCYTAVAQHKEQYAVSDLIFGCNSVINRRRTLGDRTKGRIDKGCLCVCVWRGCKMHVFRLVHSTACAHGRRRRHRRRREHRFFGVSVCCVCVRRPVSGSHANLKRDVGSLFWSDYVQHNEHWRPLPSPMWPMCCPCICHALHRTHTLIFGISGRKAG